MRRAFAFTATLALTAALVALAACASHPASPDAPRHDAAARDRGSPRPDGPVADGTHVDASAGAEPRAAAEGGPLPCGSTTCGPGEYCYHTCETSDAGGSIQPSCQRIPAACGGVLTCSCLPFDGGIVPTTCVQCGLDIFRSGCP